MENDNKKPSDMDKFLELVEQVKVICSKIVSKPKKSINGRRSPATDRGVKKTI